MRACRKCWLTTAVTLTAPLLFAAEEAKPTTLAEAKAAFAKADKALNEAWAAAKKTLAESEFAELQVKQRDWMKYREDRARGANRDNGEPEGKQTAAYFETAAELTASRADWLRRRVKNESDSLTGTWTDSFGGTLEIVQEKDRLLFTIEVVRGPTFHTGSIAGVAKWNSPLGWFTDNGREKEKTEESNLAFISRGAVLEIIGANTSYYHGARAYFDGGYCKSANLMRSAEPRSRRTLRVVRSKKSDALLFCPRSWNGRC
jgi:uncharacterized protein YecT (DUF1311 family)